MRVLAILGVLAAALSAHAKPRPHGDRERVYRPPPLPLNGLASVEVNGLIASSTIRTQLKLLEPALRKCKSGEWSFVLSFSIMPAGGIVGMKLSGVDDPATRSCANQVVAPFRSHAFKAAARSTTVESTWRFGYKPKPPPIAACASGACIEALKVGSKRLDREVIARTLHSFKYTLGRCFGSGDPVKYRAIVYSNAQGKVVRVRVSGSGTAASCLKERLKRLALPSTMKTEKIWFRVKRHDVPGGVVGGVLGGGYPRNRSRVTVGRVTVTGPLDRGVAQRRLQRTVPRIEGCYRAETKRGASVRKIRGPATATLRVRTSGRVQRVNMSGLAGARLERCVRAALSRTRFPTARRRSEVRVRLSYY